MWLQYLDDPHFCYRAKLPQFLVISPPKTGSTWLAENLRRHPQLFIPTIKEVKYFSSLYKWLDLGWYADHFAAAGERIAGEASPSYAILPVGQIRTIRRLLPDVKLIFLMRDPIARAWSHAKHTHRYREANFENSRTVLADVTESEWKASFCHEWTLTNGDYLGQLQRWSSVFPRQQMYIGFYESIETRPVEMLRDMFAFLGADPHVDLSTFPISERILQGPEGKLSPQLEETLRRLLYDRAAETIEFLREQFGLVPPNEWQRTLTPPSEPLIDLLPGAFRSETEHEQLRRVLSQEEQFHSAYRPIYNGYCGYNLIFYRGWLIAAPQETGAGSSRDASEAILPQLISEGACILAPTLTELKEQVMNRVIHGHEQRIQATMADLQATRTEIGNLRTELQTARSELHDLHAALLTTGTELKALHAHLEATRAELGTIRAELRANHEQTIHRIADLATAISELLRPSRVRLLARRVKRAGRRLMTRFKVNPN